MITITEQKSNKSVGETTLLVSFKYNPDIVSIIKSFDGAIWDKNKTAWEVPCSEINRLIDSLSLYDDIEINLLKDKKEKEEDIKLGKFKTNPFPYQLEGIKYGLTHDKWLLLDAPGLGKAFTLDTPVLTPTGFVEIKDINIGDVVFDEQGNKCNVTNLYNHLELDMYKITFSDGCTVDCCKNHLWQLEYETSDWDKINKKYIRNKHNECHDTLWLLEKDRYKKQCIRIPRCKPIKFDEKNLFLHPYVLGALLGDGCMSKGVGFTSKDTYIINKLNSLLPDNYKLYEIRNSKNNFRISCQEGLEKHTTRSGNRIKNSLKELNLYGCNSHNKFIPDIYKYSSINQRLELLRGLFDTDGYATKDNLLQYTTVSKQLAEDVRFIVESLGGIVNVKSFTSKLYGKNKSLTYNLTIRIDNPSELVSLPRKKSLLKQRKFLPRRKIINIEYIGKYPGKCLTVDSPNHLYIIKNCIVTHNTLQILYIAQELKKREHLDHCLIICGINTLKTNWAKEVIKHTNLSYKILGERVNRAGQTVYKGLKERIEDLKNPIKEFFVITNIETIRNNDIVKLINNGKNKFDMIVLDEAHCCKNVGTTQTNNFLKLKKAKYKIAATGTVLTNSPTDAYVPLKWIGVENCAASTFRYYYVKYGGPFNNEILGYKHTDVLKEELSKHSLRRTKDLLDLPEKTIINEIVDMNPAQELFYNNIVKGIVGQVDKVNITTSSLLAMVARLRQATACPSILTTEKIESSKIERCIDLINQIISNGEKVVVYSTFKETLNVVADKIKELNPLICTGDIKDDVISKNIDKFQRDENCKVMLATWSKMGTGITLTASNNVIFIDCAWTAANNEQAEDRCHRIGSKKPVFVYYLWANNTFDMQVKDIVEDKSLMANYIVDNELPPNLIERLKQLIVDLS